MLRVNEVTIRAPTAGRAVCNHVAFKRAGRTGWPISWSRSLHVTVVIWYQVAEGREVVSDEGGD